MKFQSFGISNFKAFGHSLQRMPLKPITLIFGPNSSGKSSLLQGLLWSMNVAESGEFPRPDPDISTGQANRGSFRSILHRGEEDRCIEIEVRFADPDGFPPMRFVHRIGKRTWNIRPTLIAEHALAAEFERRKEVWEKCR